MNREFDVLMEAKDIPNGSKVTKRTGEKVYILTDTLTIYSCDDVASNKHSRIIKAPEGKKFLVVNEHINEVFTGTKLIWKTTLRTLAEGFKNIWDKEGE